MKDTPYKTLHADTGEAVYLWLPPYLTCRPDREAEARALFEARLKQYKKGGQANEMPEMPKRGA